jgi:hypothetical protein
MTVKWWEVNGQTLIKINKERSYVLYLHRQTIAGAGIA